MNIIYKGLVIGETQYPMQVGDIVRWSGMFLKVDVLDLYDEPMCLLKKAPLSEKCVICKHPLHATRCECVDAEAPYGCVCEFVGWQIDP